MPDDDRKTERPERVPIAGSPSAAASEQSAGSLLRAAAILRAIASGGKAGASLSDLCERTGLPRPTIHRVTQMLERLGWVDRDPSDKNFYLGVELATLGMTAQMRYSLESLGRPILADLCSETGQTVYLITRSGIDSICIALCESGSQFRTLVLEVGSRQPLGVGAGSMAILAALPEDEVEQVIEANHERYLAYAGFDLDTFRGGLYQARERGHAWHESLFTRGVSGIGVAVLDGSGEPIAAISTVFIVGWLDDAQRERCVAKLTEAAKLLSSRLFGSTSSQPSNKRGTK